MYHAYASPQWCEVAEDFEWIKLFLQHFGEDFFSKVTEIHSYNWVKNTYYT